ncbi:MAG: bifunctional metallophosphatase/5'-nucleotidase, partial [bacterium]|nr:bifunctional metallophosphatase/5'-nucleotidase [bacterium]
VRGTSYVNIPKGKSAVLLMNAVGYNFSGLGNHEFDFGYEHLKALLAEADFTVLCGDVFDDAGNPLFPGYAIYTNAYGKKIGFFGLETPETQTKVNPALIKGVNFIQREELYDMAQKYVDLLKKAGCDLIICIGHLGIDQESMGNRSIDVLANTKGIDFWIDGHSHSVFSGYEGYKMQQTGIQFANIGVIIIDNKTAEIEDYYLLDTAPIAPDPTVLALAKAIEAEVDAIWGIKFAESKVELNGEKAPGNRDMETNNGDLITDAMLWFAASDPEAIKVPMENVVAITNGGGIRAWIHAGDVTMKDVNDVLPFGNTVTVAYLTGAELLEALEASTYCTPEKIGGFPQVSGMKYTIDTTKAYDPQPETYPGSTYYGPKTINRVTINEINGKPFDINATYAVVTNDFCTNGGDTYYAFLAATEKFDTSVPLDEAVMSYITEVLGGVIGEQYAEPQGRITIIK